MQPHINIGIYIFWHIIRTNCCSQSHGKMSAWSTSNHNHNHHAWQTRHGLSRWPCLPSISLASLRSVLDTSRPGKLSFSFTNVLAVENDSDRITNANMALANQINTMVQYGMIVINSSVVIKAYQSGRWKYPQTAVQQSSTGEFDHSGLQFL